MRIESAQVVMNLKKTLIPFRACVSERVKNARVGSGIFDLSRFSNPGLS